MQSSQMKWLVVGSSFETRNGYGVLCRSLVEALDRTGKVRMELMTGGALRGLLPGRHRLKSEWVTRKPLLWPFFVLHDLAVLFLSGRGNQEGVLVLVEHYLAAAWIYAKLFRIPCISLQCGTYAVKLPHDFRFFKIALESCDRVTPISHFTCKRMREEGVNAKFTVITLGVDKSRFRFEGNPVKEKAVVFVGNLKSRKGLDFLVTALELAVLEVPDLVLKVVGKIDVNSADYREIENRLSAAGIRHAFLGSVSDAELVRTYATARLNALPSRTYPLFFEGFGLIHLEANACGTLTVGTRESGNEDAVGPGCGSLVDFGDAEGLARVIVSAMTLDPYPRIPIESLRTWDDVAEEYYQVMVEVGKRRGTLPPA